MNKLKYISDIIQFEIINYSQQQFEFQDWIIYDEYLVSKFSNIKFGDYRIIVETKKNVNNNNLGIKALQTNEFIAKLRKLLKYSLTISLNNPKNLFHHFFRGVILPTDTPYGWSSNFKELDSNFNKKKGPPFLNTIIFPMRGRTIDHSPITDLGKMLNNYEGVNDHIRTLIDLHYFANEANYDIRNLVLGKVLEIIDQLYKNDKCKKNDTRIIDFFPEIIKLFNGTSITNLRKLANARRETRHYTIDNKTKLALPSFTQAEALNYFLLIDYLAFSVVRREFGLIPIEIILKN